MDQSVEASAKKGINCGFHHFQCINQFTVRPTPSFRSRKPTNFVWRWLTRLDEALTFMLRAVIFSQLAGAQLATFVELDTGIDAAE
jgi:hypothetical protein